MLFNAFMLHFLFKISIFILFSYHVVGLISRYIIPYLFNAIKQEHEDHMRLVEKDKLLVSTKRRVDGQLHHQKMMFALLERNVQVWQKKVQQDIENKETIQMLKQQELQQKRILQEHNFCLHKDLQAVVHGAIKNAKIELEKQYSGKEGKQVLSSVIESLGKQKPSLQR